MTQSSFDASSAPSLSALGEWAARSTPAVLSLVFALGFAWSQFAELKTGLVETRAELSSLRADFIAYQLDQRDLVSRRRLAEQLQAQREADRRHDAALTLLGEAFGRTLLESEVAARSDLQAPAP